MEIVIPRKAIFILRWAEEVPAESKHLPQPTGFPACLPSNYLTEHQNILLASLMCNLIELSVFMMMSEIFLLQFTFHVKNIIWKQDLNHIEKCIVTKSSSIYPHENQS